MAPEVKTAKNSKLPKLPENCFEPVGKGGWPPISTGITSHPLHSKLSHVSIFFSNDNQMKNLIFSVKS